MKRNGSPEPIFETDDERTYFLAVLPVHPEVKKKGEVGGEDRGEAGGQAGGQAEENGFNDTEKAILGLLHEGACSAEEIAKKLGLKKRTGSLQRTLKGLLEKEYIRFLYPDIPRHPEQKYVLNKLP